MINAYVTSTVGMHLQFTFLIYLEYRLYFGNISSFNLLVTISEDLLLEVYKISLITSQGNYTIYYEQL